MNNNNNKKSSKNLYNNINNKNKNNNNKNNLNIKKIIYDEHFGNKNDNIIKRLKQIKSQLELNLLKNKEK